MTPTLSLIVPTRGRTWQLRRFLDSLASTTSKPGRLEIILVMDDDDIATHTISRPGLSIRRVIGPPGRTMGTLNSDGYAASSGEWVMLLNDDVIVQTRGWDVTVQAITRRFPDRLALIHVNDTLLRHHLCVFPIISREFCNQAGGICPPQYRRYRIDDHIEDVFNLLAAVGHRRTVYLPDVVFEHRNAVIHPTAGRVYASDPTILAADAPLFDDLFSSRKELALQLVARLGGNELAARRYFATLTDPFALRTPNRHILVREPWWRRLSTRAAADWFGGQIRRASACYGTKGCLGLVRAAGRRLVTRGSRAGELTSR